jgi:MOSC domain-containing protein YiiM
MNSRFQMVNKAANTALTDGARILSLINRPSEGIHIETNELHLDTERGIVGDRWRDSAWLRRPDGSPDPRVQVSLTNLAVMQCFADETGRSPFDCGDNLYTHLSLTETNLPVGQRLRIGAAVLEVSDVENDACGKFAQRFGASAFQYIRAPQNRHLRLRGIFCRILRGGVIRVGELITKE